MMPHPRKLTLSLATLIILLAAHAIQADPLTFSNVRAVQLSPNDHTTNVTTDLFANPGASLTNGTTVSFFIDVAGTLQPGATDTLRLTLVLADGSTVVNDFSIPVFGTGVPPFTLVTGFDFPTYYQAVPLTLTVDLLNSNPDFVIPSGMNAGQSVNSYTYTFSVVQPVPEPATILLLATGLGGVMVNVRDRRRGRKLARRQ
jgi:hypothetical protein